MNEHVQTATTEPLFNPLAPAFIRDPYPSYARLRATDPMHLTPFGSYVASRHAEASLVLRDKRFGKDFVDRSTRRYGPKILEEPVIRSMSHWMLQQDPPDHTRLRGLVVQALRSACVVQVSGGWGGSAKCDSGAVAGGAACWWCSGIALAWKAVMLVGGGRGGRLGWRRCGGSPAVAGAAVARPLRDGCRRLAGAVGAGGHAGGGSAPAARQW